QFELLPRPHEQPHHKQARNGYRLPELPLPRRIDLSNDRVVEHIFLDGVLEGFSHDTLSASAPRRPLDGIGQLLPGPRAWSARPPRASSLAAPLEALRCALVGSDAPRRRPVPPASWSTPSSPHPRRAPAPARCA